VDFNDWHLDPKIEKKWSASSFCNLFGFHWAENGSQAFFGRSSRVLSGLGAGLSGVTGKILGREYMCNHQNIITWQREAWSLLPKLHHQIFRHLNKWFDWPQNLSRPLVPKDTSHSPQYRVVRWVTSVSRLRLCNAQVKPQESTWLKWQDFIPALVQSKLFKNGVVAPHQPVGKKVKTTIIHLPFFSSAYTYIFKVIPYAIRRKISHLRIIISTARGVLVLLDTHKFRTIFSITHPSFFCWSIRPNSICVFWRISQVYVLLPGELGNFRIVENLIEYKLHISRLGELTESSVIFQENRESTVKVNAPFFIFGSRLIFRSLRQIWIRRSNF